MSLKKIAVAAAAAGLLATGSAMALAGTAQAATRGPDTAVATTTPILSWFDPHGRRFRAHFRTYAQCVFFANHDHNPRTHGWDCRRGGDRNFPWEYWY